MLVIDFNRSCSELPPRHINYAAATNVIDLLSIKGRQACKEAAITVKVRSQDNNTQRQEKLSEPTRRVTAHI